MAFRFSQEQIEAVKELGKIVAPISWVLVGSVAMACQMEWTRETQDLDITIAVDVADLQALMDRLPCSGRRHVPEHTWISPGGAKIDLLPAGSGSPPAKSFRWPRSGNIVNISGLHLAFEHTLPFQADEGLVIRIAQFRVVLLLKMVSYMDDPYTRQKDLQDIAYIISRELLPDDDRRWTENILKLQINYELVSAYVLGKELREIVGEDEIPIVRSFVSKVKDESDAHSTQLKMARLGPAMWQNDPEIMLECIDAFVQGFDARGPGTG